MQFSSRIRVSGISWMPSFKAKPGSDQRLRVSIGIQLSRRMAASIVTICSYIASSVRIAEYRTFVGKEKASSNIVNTLVSRFRCSTSSKIFSRSCYHSCSEYWRPDWHIETIKRAHDGFDPSIIHLEKEVLYAFLDRRSCRIVCRQRSSL